MSEINNNACVQLRAPSVPLHRPTHRDALQPGVNGPQRTAVRDNDDVTADMPRHPGLVAAAAGSGAGTTEGDSTDVERSTVGLVVPPLQGVAAATPGAALAARVWRRFLR